MPQKIIDTHLHIWNLTKAEYTWLQDDETIINRTYNISEVEEERLKANISEAILVQAANNFEDTNWMLQVAAKTPWVAGVVGWLPLQQPELLEKRWIETYKHNPAFKGVRHLIHIEPDTNWLLQEAVIESLKLIANYKLSYDVVGILPEHLEVIIQLGEKVPELRMVLDHINQPPIATKETFGRWGELIKEASANPNLYAKISGLGTASKNLQGWQPDDLKPYINFALEQFGTERCCCGSDWPVSLLAGTYSKTWQAYQDIIASLLSEEDQNKVLYHNAATFYNLH